MEDAHITCEFMGDVGVHTLNQPRLGSSYILPRLWDLGGVTTTSNVSRIIYDQPSVFATTSRYPYATCMHSRVELSSLQQ